MRYFCTYFDHRYLPKGLALYSSLRQHCEDFQLWVLCLSPTCHNVLSQLNLPGIHLIKLEDFERGDEALLKAKQNRTLVEYYFTCSPSLPLYVLNHHPEVDLITYLDADLYFFSDLTPLYQAIEGHSIGIIEHRFSPEFLDLVVFGIYNVGWLSFRRDPRGLACLQWWRERCIEWCYDHLEETRFADQKYLDDWTTRFPGVVVLPQKGANVAHWNTGNYQFYADGKKIWVDEQPLIFFHFHGFNNGKKVFEMTALNPEAKLKRYSDRVIFREIYSPYLQTLRAIAKQVEPLMPEVAIQSSIRYQPIRADNEQPQPYSTMGKSNSPTDKTYSQEATAVLSPEYIEHQLATALQYYQVGQRLREAEELCYQVLQQQPEHLEAQQLFERIIQAYDECAQAAEQRGDLEDAISLYQYALVKRPNWDAVRDRFEKAIQKLILSDRPVRIYIGINEIYDPGQRWVSTHIETLDLLKPEDWKNYFSEASIDAILAEHVWEHLTHEEGIQAASLCYRYLKPGGYLRVAVPDGLHPDPNYLDLVKPGGKGYGASDHKILYDYLTFQSVFERAGFQVKLLEYFDRSQQFHFNEWNPEQGKINRSKRFDERNKSGILAYTSIILDAIKPLES